MPLDYAERNNVLRQRVVDRYGKVMIDTPTAVLDFLAGYVVLVSRCHMPKFTRYAFSERLRDLADLLEHED
jgi:hypothetical protein